MKSFARSLSALLLLGVLCVTTFSFLFISHSGHMDGVCPFMSHQHSLCPMDALDHISALAKAVAPATALMIVFGVGFVLFRAYRSLSPAQVTRRLTPLIENDTLLRFAKRALQSMFARGILHPKLH